MPEANLDLILRAAASVSLWLAVWLLPLGLFSGALYFVMSLPLRRQERARFFLDVLETGLKAGLQPEHVLISLARSRETSLGVRFHLVAAYVESGLSLVEAIEKAGGFVPPQIVAILRVGEQIGDFRRVLPGCRRLLTDGQSRLRAAVNYQILMLMVFNPVVLLILPFIYDLSIPTIGQVYRGFGAGLPPLMRFFTDYSAVIYGLQWIGLGALCVGAALFVGGHRLIHWAQAGLFPASDWLSYFVPWQRKRLQRDFSTMLALLLDAEVSEDRALMLAAESTANGLFVRRAERVISALQQGQPLTEAVERIDPSGELRWRLTNASRAQKGFLAALEGWHEALEAKAYQQEQAAAQVLSTALLLLNGFVVTAITSAIFETIYGLSPLAIGRH